MAEVPADAVVVLVHDAARPLLPDDVIERVLAPLSEGWDGAVPGLPVADTLKRVGAGRRDRGDGVARRALGRADAAGVSGRRAARARSPAGGDATDCAALVEARGGRVKVVEGDPRLLKVTTADDLAKIVAWLQ